MEDCYSNLRGFAQGFAVCKKPMRGIPSSALFVLIGIDQECTVN
ncbi:hypothetical protein PORCAN_1566 [Porphyromonas crevioricanis JCM 13913]|nr:hypothetical protein PORCAN_1566 [Porphyromonas crevioricanis JCM 13913]